MTTFAQLVVWGWVAPSFSPGDLALLAYRLRLEVARTLLARWAREGYRGVLLVELRVEPVKVAPDAGLPVWALGSPEARQLVVMSLAVGEVYREAHDPVGTGPGLERRLAALREELANINVARALVA